MSYDVTFVFTDVEDAPETWRNYTSNVSPMWFEAIGENTTLGDLIDKYPEPADLLPYIERGITAMEADPDKYRAMNPENGWGDYQGALDYLRWIASACRAYRDSAKVTVWR